MKRADLEHDEVEGAEQLADAAKLGFEALEVARVANLTEAEGTEYERDGLDQLRLHLKAQRAWPARWRPDDLD